MKPRRNSWTYRGHSIERTFPSGMFETYVDGRFMRADTLAGARTIISNGGR